MSVSLAESEGGKARSTSGEDGAQDGDIGSSGNENRHAEKREPSPDSLRDPSFSAQSRHQLLIIGMGRENADRVFGMVTPIAC